MLVTVESTSVRLHLHSYACRKLTRGIGCSFVSFDAKPVERASYRIVGDRDIVDDTATRNGTDRNSVT
jgi:hypothetical protein